MGRKYKTGKGRREERGGQGREMGRKGQKSGKGRDIGVGDGGTCLKFGKITFGQLLCKVRAFWGKNHIKFGDVVNFSGKYHKNSGILIIFRARIM